MPNVSIIMPLYNSARFVKKAIESVISQTYQDWELLVINDCSKDESQSVVEDLAKRDSRIRMLHTDLPSGGPAIPRNLGVEQAQGRYIAFLDSDDMWYPKKLEEQLPLFEDPETVIVFSYYRKMREDEGVSMEIVKSPKRVNYRQLLKGNVIGNLTGIYDTQKVGKHYFMTVGHEDYVYWLHILKQGGFATNTQKLHGLYRITTGSVSNNKFKAMRWDWYIFRHIEKLSFPYACYCFAHYAVKGLIKYMI